MAQIVGCPVCGKQLPIDFFECPECGQRNPQLHLVKREVIRVSFAPEVFRTMKRKAIFKGWSLDKFVNEAVEFYITEIAKRGS